MLDNLQLLQHILYVRLHVKLNSLKCFSFIERCNWSQRLLYGDYRNCWTSLKVSQELHNDFSG